MYTICHLFQLDIINSQQEHLFNIICMDNKFTYLFYEFSRENEISPHFTTVHESKGQVEPIWLLANQQSNIRILKFYFIFCLGFLIFLFSLEENRWMVAPQLTIACPSRKSQMPLLLFSTTLFPNYGSINPNPQPGLIFYSFSLLLFFIFKETINFLRVPSHYLRNIHHLYFLITFIFLLDLS